MEEIPRASCEGVCVDLAPPRQHLDMLTNGDTLRAHHLGVCMEASLTKA